jgi:Tol biopolymer transport system component
MNKTVFAMLALAGAVVAAQPSALTPEQTLDRRGIGELDLSPDGARLLFTVTEPVKGTARQRNIWMLDVASGAVRQLTFSAKNDSAPRWAPDGRSIAFLSDRDGPAQLYLLAMSGGEAEKITDRKESIGAFRWSPDGRRIALLMPEPKPEAQLTREKNKDDARVAEKEDRLSRLWVLDVASHAITQVATSSIRIAQVEFAPSGDRLFAAASPKPHADQFNEAIYSIDLDGGRTAQIRGASRTDGGHCHFAGRQDHRVRVCTCRRTGSARPLPSTGGRWRQPQHHRGHARSTCQSAEVD